MPFRPMIRDRMSGALVQAWPQLERELLEVRCRHTAPTPSWSAPRHEFVLFTCRGIKFTEGGQTPSWSGHTVLQEVVFVIVPLEVFNPRKTSQWILLVSWALGL